MSESSQRGLVTKALRALHAVAVENPAFPGTPDVNYVEGWIELKELDRWPKNADESPVLVEHYTPQQRRWQVERRIAHGTCWFVLKVGQEWLLYDAAIAALHVGLVPRPELRKLAAHQFNRFDNQEFLECISQPMKSCWSTAAEKASLRLRLLETLRYLSADT